MEKSDFAFFKFDAAALIQFGLKEIQYPVPSTQLPRIISSDEIHHHLLLLWLQLYSSVSPEEWKDLEDAMLALINLIGGDDQHSTANVAGDTWSFKAASVDLTKEVVTIQRKEHLLAAIMGAPKGGVIISHYRPLDAKSIRYILGMTLNPNPDGSVCMRPNNFEYAKDCSAGMGNTYAFMRGEAHLSYWEHGIGLDQERKPVEGWSEQRALEPLSAHALAVQIGNYYQYADDEDL